MVKEKYLPYEPPVKKPEPVKTAAEIRREKWENFWFYYKLPIAIGLFALITALIAFEPWAKKEEPDYTVMVAAPYIWSDTNLADLETMLSFYGEDVNGDGEIKVRAQSYWIDREADTGENIEMVQTYLVKLVSDISTCQGYVLLCDDACAEWLGFSEQVFCRLDDKSFSEVPWDDEATTLDTFSVNWHNVEAFDNSVTVQAMKNLDLRLTMRTNEGLALDHPTEYAQSQKLVENMLNNTPTQPEAFQAWVAEQQAAMQNASNNAA